MKKEKDTVKTADQDFPLEHVPVEKSSSILSIVFLFLGFTFFTPTMASGASIAQAFTFNKLVWILVAGSLILGIYVAIMGYICARTRISSIMQAKYTYGKFGVKLVDLILGGTQIFWFAITAEYMADLFALGLNLDTPFWHIFFLILFSLGMCITAYYGIKGMSIVAYIAIPAMAILLILSVSMAVNKVGSFAALNDILPTAQMSAASAITVIVGTFASGGTTIGNYSRFCKSGKHAIIAGLIAFTIGNGAILFVGILGGLAFQTGDIIELMFSMGMIVPALVILTTNIWTTNTASAYAYGVAGAEMFNKPSNGPFIIGGSILAVLMALLGVSNYFIPILNLLGVFVPPLGGAMIGDYFFVYKGRIPKLPYVSFKTIRIAPTISFILGCLAAYLGNIYNFGIAPVQGIIVSAACVPLIDWILKKCKINDAHTIKEDAEYI